MTVKISNGVTESIRQDFINGMFKKDIASEYCISVRTVVSILEGIKPDMDKLMLHRLMTKTEKLDESCWIWKGAMNKPEGKGYGVLRDIDEDGNTRLRGAHIISYERHNKVKVPKGMCVLHKCDNPRCVNPAHLFLGTHQDNADDMIAKDRSAKGEKNGNSKLTEEDVLNIRTEANAGMKRWLIAKKYGVTIGTIGLVVKRVTWSWV